MRAGLPAGGSALGGTGTPLPHSSHHPMTPPNDTGPFQQRAAGTTALADRSRTPPLLLVTPAGLFQQSWTTSCALLSLAGIWTKFTRADVLEGHTGPRTDAALPSVSREAFELPFRWKTVWWTEPERFHEALRRNPGEPKITGKDK